MESTKDQNSPQGFVADEDQISRMLGLHDRLHLFDDSAYHDPSVHSSRNSSLNCSEEEIPGIYVETYNNYLNTRMRHCDEDARIENHSNSPPHRHLGEYCCSSSDKCRQSNSNSDKSKISQIASGIRRSSSMYRHWCLLSVSIAFGLGVLLGIFIPFVYLTKDVITQEVNSSQFQSLKLYNKSYREPLSFEQTSSDYIKNLDMPKKNVLADRIFVPAKSKLEYKNIKPSFPTIYDIKSNSKTNFNKPLEKIAIKLNKPKIFPSVSFVEDDIKQNADSKNFTNERELETKKTLLKYLDLENSNASLNYFEEFGKKILETNLEKNVENTSVNMDDDRTILHKNIYWGARIEKSLPMGYDSKSHIDWVNYIKTSSAIKMETGCGRMQNRLVTFIDGRQACVRYRQNTDQIQGELFSFYLAQVLNLPNLAPSIVSVVNLTDPLWQNIASDIGSAQWNSNRAVVMTKYIPNLEVAHIPNVFKPSERHLNKFDVMNIIKRGVDNDDHANANKGDILLKKLTEGIFNDIDIKSNLIDNEVTEEKQIFKVNTDMTNEGIQNTTISQIKADIGDTLLDRFIELAQWSDLIIFDYLTANLDRIVNNLYNFQWNVNIMDAPAHNLARKMDSNLLLFLDNESGLLHGYRLLNKYEAYHTVLLDSLCVFRKSTADTIKRLHKHENIGDVLNRMFKDNNNAAVIDVLPPLPEKSIKILNERIARVASQIKTCEEQFER